jgi:hypothetical protein
MGVTAPARKSQPTEIWLLAALKRHPDQIERVRHALPVWASDERVNRVLADLSAGALPGPDEWPLLGDTHLESLYAALWQYDEPDSGAAVIDDLIWSMERENARHRYEEIKELLRQGNSSPELLDEVRRLSDRLERYQYRKEG